ncbi:MAG: ABC transporter permease, partial [Thermogutta sp.]|nr:ABC transporter permease [Thermogutta sp.]
MTAGQSYWQIVWKQFRRNPFSVGSLWVLAVLFLLAIFAPVLASNIPFYYHDERGTAWPWFRALFNPEQAVDYWFNLALVAFFPWLLGVVIHAVRYRRRYPDRLLPAGRYAAAYVLAILALGGLLMIPGVRPDNRYRARTFPEEEFARQGTARAVYPLIPFGPTEQDMDSPVKPPLYRKPQFTTDPVTGEKILFWRKSNDGFPHILGTDDVGRDVLVRMIYGLRISLTVGFVAVGIYMVIGIVLGAVAGYYGGFVDILISRIIEVIMLFPAFFLILTLVGLLGQSIYIIMVVIGFTGWP